MFNAIAIFGIRLSYQGYTISELKYSFKEIKFLFGNRSFEIFKELLDDLCVHGRIPGIVLAFQRTF